MKPKNVQIISQDLHFVDKNEAHLKTKLGYGQKSITFALSVTSPQDLAG